MSVYVYASLVGFVCIALLLPFVPAFCLVFCLFVCFSIVFSTCYHWLDLFFGLVALFSLYFYYFFIFNNISLFLILINLFYLFIFLFVPFLLSRVADRV